MERIFFSLPGNEALTKLLAQRYHGTIGETQIRHFPDGESYVRILTDVKGKNLVFVCTLHEPDSKLLPLFFLIETAKTLGAATAILVAPYLAYMRQDKVFQPGEGVTSTYFAKLVSGFADKLITIDPHLHRRSSLSEIYSIPTHIGHAADHISAWIKVHVEKAVLVGPDSESEQWVAAVAEQAGAPYIVLSKIRHGDKDVEVSVPDVDRYTHHTPVLVDDIISTGRTMIETIGHLKRTGMKPPVVIGIHAVFAANAYDDIKSTGVAKIITCNTIPHPSNGIDISDLLLLD